MGTSEIDAEKILGQGVSYKDIHWTVTILSDCPELVRNAERLAGALISPAELEDIKRSVVNSSSWTYSFLTSLLRKWTAKKGSTFASLVSVLKEEKFNSAAGALLQKLEERSTSIFDGSINSDNMGISFGLHEPIDSFTGRERELQQIRSSFSDSRAPSPCVVITGLGGIGKSELARMYIHQNQMDYKNCIWINAENYNSIVRCFKELAQNELNITLKNIDGEEKDIKYIVKEVYGSGKICSVTLFIFDNAEKYRSEAGGDGLLDFLPQPKRKTFHTLITSRNSQWGASIIPCPLSILTVAESDQLITNTLGTDRALKHDDVIQLGDRLQHFPLALQQAMAYIIQTDEELRNVNKGYSIADYLLEYETQTLEALSINFPEFSNDKYAHTVSTTWEITFAKIKNELYGQLAVNILNVCAYLAPDNIPSEMLMSGCDQRQLGSVLQILKKYSMVNVNNGVISIHRLVQDVVRLKIRQDGQETDLLKTIFGCLQACFPKGESLENYVQKRKMLVHLEIFLTKVESYLGCIYTDVSDSNVEGILDSYGEYTAMLGITLLQFGHAMKAVQLFEDELVRKMNLYGAESYKLANTMESLARAYGHMGVFRKENKMLREFVAIRRSELGPNHSEVAKVMKYLANSYGNLGYADKKRKLLEQALILTEAHYGPDHYETGSIVGHLGNAYNNIGNYVIGKEFLERALLINERHYGADHIECSKTLTNLGITYSDLGDHEKGIELLERGLKIKEKHYGHDNFFVGKTLGDLGNVYRKLGNCMKARDLIERAVVIIEKNHGSYHVQLCSVLMNLAMTYESLGDLQKREEVLQKATMIANIQRRRISRIKLQNSGM